MVVRGDGCGSGQCTGSGNPNVGITVYDSANVSLQNVLVVDRILASGTSYADFATAQHTSGRAFGNNEWLGTISLNSEDSCYIFEADETSLKNPAWRLHDVIGWNCTSTGFNASGEADSSTELLNGTFLVRGGDGVAVRVPAERARNTIARVIVTGTARYATNIGTDYSYFDQHGQWADGLVCRPMCGRLQDQRSDPGWDSAFAPLPDAHRTGIAAEGRCRGSRYRGQRWFRYGADGTFQASRATTNSPLCPFGPGRTRI